MTYQTIQEFNATGLDEIFIYTASQVPLLIPFILFSFFMIIVFISYFMTSRMTGRGDIWGSLAVAGFLTAIIATVMTLAEGLINMPTLIIVYTISFVLVFILFITKER